MPVAKGTQIGPYEILGWLGSGGMGEVYRARDPRLDRDVAIKLIPEGLAADPRRLRWFEREARAAGQISHPNVLAVFDAGVHAGTPFIVSELIDGRSLRAVLGDGALPWRKAVDYARQIAEGLAAAHDRSILHRDVKPDNISVTYDGRVKILDFGVAKLAQSAEPPSPGESPATETAAGFVIGTVGYMSPEQIRGEELDARSDLFAVGATLYELLAGHAPFARGTQAETMTAVLRDHPELPTAIPSGLRRIVSRCLEKEPEARFQSARDLAFALEVLSDSGGRAAVGAAPGVRRPGAGVLFVVVVAAILVLATGTWMARRQPTPWENPLADAKFTPITDWEGTEALAEISPDGRFAAFLADRDGEFDIWLTQIGTGEFRNLTAAIPPMNPPGVVLRAFGFTGDGAELWFSRTGQPGDRKLLMPLLGGEPRPFLGEGDATPSWSPDGGRVVYFNNREGGGDPLFVADRAGGEARPLLSAEPGVLHNHNPVWSFDGRSVYFVRGVEPTSQMDVWRLRASGGLPERLTMQPSAVNFLAPLDARTLLYTARADDRSGPWLWALDVQTRAARRISAGLEEYTSVAASQDGRRVVATIARPRSSLWIAPILDRPADDRVVERYPVTAPRAMAPRLSSTALFYLSARGADVGLWRLQDGRALEISKGADRQLSAPPAVSSDGQRVAIAAGQDGSRRLAIMSADGTTVRTIAPSLAIEGAPGAGAMDWSPDGAWLAAGGRDARGPGLFKVPVDGGPVVRLVDGRAVNPIWSPDGRLIVYAGPFVDGQVPLLGVSPEGEPVPLASVRVREGGYRFLPDGTGIVFIPMIRSLDFWLLDLATGAQRPLTHLGDHGRLQTFDVTPDGTHIVFDRLQENADVMLIQRPD